VKRYNCWEQPQPCTLAADVPEICFLSAGEMVALIRRKKLSARETLAAHLKQIERVNPKVNAIVTLTADQGPYPWECRSSEDTGMNGVFYNWRTLSSKLQRLGGAGR